MPVMTWHFIKGPVCGKQSQHAWWLLNIALEDVNTAKQQLERSAGAYRGRLDLPQGLLRFPKPGWLS